MRQAKPARLEWMDLFCFAFELAVVRCPYSLEILYCFQNLFSVFQQQSLNSSVSNNDFGFGEV